MWVLLVRFLACQEKLPLILIEVIEALLQRACVSAYTVLLNTGVEATPILCALISA